MSRLQCPAAKAARLHGEEAAGSRRAGCAALAFASVPVSSLAADTQHPFSSRWLRLSAEVLEPRCPVSEDAEMAYSTPRGGCCLSRHTKNKRSRQIRPEGQKLLNGEDGIFHVGPPPHENSRDSMRAVRVMGKG